MDHKDLLDQVESRSHLFQRVASFLPWGLLFFNHTLEEVFSSLSESGFIPTRMVTKLGGCLHPPVLISFREWLHSYIEENKTCNNKKLNLFSSLSESGFIPTKRRFTVFWEVIWTVLISFREWLHSYTIENDLVVLSNQRKFSSLSESGFIPTQAERNGRNDCCSKSSHLFQRVASFLRSKGITIGEFEANRFSSLSESGFIPT